DGVGGDRHLVRPPMLGGNGWMKRRSRSVFGGCQTVNVTGQPPPRRLKIDATHRGAMVRNRRCVASVMAAAAVTLVADCQHGPSPTTDQTTKAGAGYVEDTKTINIVAGSEQKAVLEQIVRPWCQAHQYTCDTEQKGSVDQARLLASGNKDFDAYWFAS